MIYVLFFFSTLIKKKMPNFGIFFRARLNVASMRYWREGLSFVATKSR